MIDKIFNIIEEEQKEEGKTLDLAASSNYVSSNVLNALGSALSNKIVKGYFKNRSCLNCEFVDRLEAIAINEAKKLFNVKYANVQAYSVLNATTAVYKMILKKNDKVLVFGLESDEHLSYEQNFNNTNYNYVAYNCEKETGQINYDEFRKMALKEKPKLIIISSSSYSRKIDFIELKDIARESKSYLMINMDHISGLVAAKLYLNPCDYADVVVSSTNKTLRGPMGAVILTNSAELISKIDKNIYPGIQGAPLLNTIAAKAICFNEAGKLDFINYQKQVIKNAKILCDILKMEGFKVITNGTDNHLIIIDVKKSVNMTGKEAEKTLYEIGIICNKSLIPNDPTTPFITSGIRLGVSALTTRGLIEKDFIEIGKIIGTCLNNSDNLIIMEDLKQRVNKICNKYELYKEGVVNE